jgi:O-antigen ligase
VLNARSLVAAWPLAAVPAAAVVVALAHLTSPVVPVVLVLAAAGGAAVLARPVLGICAAVLAVPLEGLSADAGVAGLAPAELLFLVSAACAVLHLATGRTPLRAGAEHAWLAALIGIAAIGLGFARDPVVVFKLCLNWTAFLVVSAYLAGSARRDLLLVAGTLVASGGVLGLTALSGAGDIRLRAGGAAASGRAEGTFGDPNLLAFYLSLVLPLALVGAIALRGAARAASGGAALLVLAAMLLTLSRSAYLGALAALLVLLTWPPFRRVSVALLAVVVLFGAFNASAIVESRQVGVIATRLQSISAERGTNPRWRIYARTPAMIADRPLLGVGLGNFPEVSPLYGMRERGGGIFLHAHNVPLTFAAETGLLGLAALVAFILAVTRRALAAVRDRAGDLHPLGLAIAAALASMAVISITDHPFRSNPVTAVLLLEVGLLVALARRA